MSTKQPRKPAGTPAGGQWATAQHSEADIDLGPITAGLTTIGPEMTELSDGTREWRQDGELHHTDGPAVERPDGTREWFRDGKLHRTDGPAIEWADGTREWYQDGELHRTNGPAVEEPDGAREWWAHGKRVSAPPSCATAPGH